LDRLATAVAATRTVSSPGVLRTSELVVDRGRAWLVVAHPPASTVADLRGERTPLEPGRATGIAADLAEALRDLHAVGLGHGGLGPDTTILTPAGRAMLTEVGVLAAINASPVDVSRDSVAWEAVARQLAGLAPEGEARGLRASAEVAELGHLATAVRRLRADGVEAHTFAVRSTIESPGVRVRLRFGPGVPEPAAGRGPTAAGRPPMG